MTRLAPGDLLSVAEARRILPLPKSTFYELIRTGALPHVRVPAAGGGRGRVFVLRADLEAFVDGARLSATRAATRLDVDGLLAKMRGKDRRA